MSAENLVINNSSNWKAIKAIGERLPQANIEASFNFVIKSVNSIDARTFVISTQEEEVLGVFDLISEEQADGLQALFSTIYVITQK